jgi:hypothetical protein
MQTTPENIDTILPYGESLRSFIEQPFISKSDLRNALRSRGVFVSGSDKEDTIPVAICCLFSPSEFGQLKECQLNREDNPKTLNRYLEWKSEASLITSVPDNLNLSELLADSAPYCKMLGNPSFVPVGNDPNHIRLDFEVERSDYTKSWARTKDTYKGSIGLEKIYDGNVLKVLITYTAEETKILGSKTDKFLKKHFETAGCVIAGSRVGKILFNDFTNENRVQFFWKLTGENQTTHLTFKDVTDFDVRPDPDSGDLPDDIKWMDKKVDDLKLKGKNLHETIFIKDKNYHKFLHLYKIETKFEFSYFAAAGTCTITFEFAGFLGSAGKMAEFEANISSLVLKSEYRNVNKLNVKEHLLRAMELFTLNQYSTYRRPPSPNDASED